MIFSTIFILRHHSQRVWLFLLFLFFSCLQSEGWPHHGRTFSIYLCPMSFWSILPRGVLSTLMLSISKVARRVSSFFLNVQLSQPYVATAHTSAFISRIFVEIGLLWLFHIFCKGPKVRERIQLLQLLILNEYAAHYAIARHYPGLVNVDE